jgi:hypothetical protein
VHSLYQSGVSVTQSLSSYNEEKLKSNLGTLSILLTLDGPEIPADKNFCSLQIEAPVHFPHQSRQPVLLSRIRSKI